LKFLLSMTFGASNFLASIIWQKVFAPKNTARDFSEDHDYVLAYARQREHWLPCLLPRSGGADSRYSNPDDDPRGPWTSSDLTGRNYYGEGQYEVTSPSGVVFRPPIGRYWTVSAERFRELDQDHRIWWGPAGGNMPRLKRFLAEVKPGVVPRTLWTHKEAGNTQEAKRELLSALSFGRTEDVLNTVKPTRLLGRIIGIAGTSDGSDWILDFFAGSGTTGHAVMNLNREDGGRRKFILVEVADYFDTVLLPRIAKVMYTPEWKDGRPRRQPTPEEAARTPRIVKVLRLESYEDALHNLVAPSTLERAAAHEGAYRALAGEEYMLRYWIELPLREAETCLRAFDLAHPFRYSLEVLTDAGPVRKPVDLIETFNWLYGLRVRRYETWHDDTGREYRAVRASDREGRRRILVLWRDMEGLSPEAERAFLEAKLRDLEASGERWDEVLINGDSPTPGVRSLDADFKRLMMQGEAV
ncbi:MAG: site-specific DNA-methyltransferase, partial [Anaerolineae bacterium]|nr:site-specific DNA-methyltransferase [Anaerolineae bacterium]